MRTSALMGAVMAVVLVSALESTHAHGVKTPTLEMVHPYALETGPGAASAAVYLTIESRSRKGDRLEGAVTPLAKSVEPNGRVDLRRAGPHLLLIGLTKPLSAWDTFPLTLIFARAGRIEVEVLVEEDLGPKPM